MALTSSNKASSPLLAPPDEEIEKAALAVKEVCGEFDVAFIVNDNPALAKKVDADGVHLGEDDCSVVRAREIVGDNATIGVSCYGSRHRAMEVAEKGADYVAFGAFYETQTKEPKGRPTPDILEEWSEFTTIPCVAIGGIKAHNGGVLVKAGADFIAVVTAVWDHPSGPKKAVEELNAMIDEDTK
jgi:thiamine-phosphate pyrophosphorylase